MAYRQLSAEEAYWRESNQMGVLNTDLAGQLEAESFGARLWRLRPGEASTRHRHRDHEELYLLLEGTGRIRIEDQLITMNPMDTVLVDSGTVRQIFNDTDREALWMVVGAPPEQANTLEMSSEQLAWHYPDGPRALPPELGEAA